MLLLLPSWNWKRLVLLTTLSLSVPFVNDDPRSLLNWHANVHCQATLGLGEITRIHAILISFAKIQLMFSFQHCGLEEQTKLMKETGTRNFKEHSKDHFNTIDTRSTTLGYQRIVIQIWFTCLEVIRHVQMTNKLNIKGKRNHITLADKKIVT